MLPNERQQSGNLNVAHLHNSALNIVEAACGVVSRPLELVLRPWHGTRYFPVPIIALSTLMMIVLPLISAMMTGIAAMIPFSHPARPIGMFDITSFAKLYFLLSAIHGFRLYRRMVHMHLEDHSNFEGPALPFFQLIPWSRSFWLTRIVFEPAFVLLTAIVLQDLFIIQSGLATYLQLAAIALAMKNFVSWYRAWEYLRDLLDARNAGPILASLIENKATDEDLASINLASFPKDVPPEIRTQAAITIARAYSPITEP
jgi:hypothetical protein